MQSRNSILFLLATLSKSRTEESVIKQDLRILHGRTGDQKEFPYVVALCRKNELKLDYVKVHRVCTGSLIADDWVITAAHCVLPIVTRIRYGDMVSPPTDSNVTFSTIIKSIKHPAYNHKTLSNFGLVYMKMSNDIALLHVERVPLNKYGKLSGVEFIAMVGRSVRYAGFGTTYGTQIGFKKRMKILQMDQRRPLQIGEAVVVRCEKSEGLDIGPHICLAPKCSLRTQVTRGGDSGGPLFFSGKIAGVCMGGMSEFDNRYTPVSPYMDWIEAVMSSE